MAISSRMRKTMTSLSCMPFFFYVCHYVQNMILSTCVSPSLWFVSACRLQCCLLGIPGRAALKWSCWCVINRERSRCWAADSSLQHVLITFVNVLNDHNINTLNPIKGHERRSLCICFHCLLDCDTDIIVPNNII